MKSFIAALRNLVLPWGRTSGRRIVLDGDNGEIDIYDATNALVVVLTSQTPPGLTVGAAGNPQVQILSQGNIGRILFDANSPAAGVLAAITEAIFNSGTPTENISLQLQGPGVIGATDRLELLINSQNTNGSSEANYNLRLAGGNSLHNVDKTSGHSMFRRLAIAPPASAANSALLVAADAAHTAALHQGQVGSSAKYVFTYDGRLGLFTDGVATPAIIVAADGAFSGDFLDFGTSGVQQFAVNSAGIIDNYNENGFFTYTPTVGNGGAVTWSTRTGWWMRIGGMIYVGVYLVVNGAGSGAGIVTVDMPTNVYRGTRQTLTMHCESVGPGGSHIGDGQCVFFTGGSGATADRLRNSSNGATNADANITGADLLAGGIITIEGWYREA